MKPSRFIVLAAVAVLSLAAGQPAPRGNWNSMVAVTPEGGHVIGKPAARVKLVEYVSYTCSHCADFETQADTQLRIGFISTGKGSVEYRSYLRNDIDVAATLLAQCGPVAKFRGNHAALLRGQANWLREPAPAERRRWSNPEFATANRAIARDLRLYELMERRGYTIIELDRCLADKPLADRLAAQTKAAIEIHNVEGTPSFLINGTLQDVHDWRGLRPKLMALTR